MAELEVLDKVVVIQVNQETQGDYKASRMLPLLHQQWV